MIKMLSGTGWRPQPVDERDYTTKHPSIQDIYKSVRENPLPIHVDLRGYCTPIEDQGNLGSCTAQAACGLVEYREYEKHGNYTDQSRLFEYYNSRIIDDLINQGDTGATIRASVKALIKYGSCVESLWPYNIQDFEVKPPNTCYDLADDHQALTYISLNSLQEIKETLSIGNPVLIGFNVYDSLTNGPEIPYPKREDTLLGGHAVLVVGYDDTKGALLIRNSWGTSWGYYGYGWLPYRYITDGLADDFWTVFTFEDTNEPEPNPDEDEDPTFYEVLSQLFRSILTWIRGVIGF